MGLRCAYISDISTEHDRINLATVVATCVQSIFEEENIKTTMKSFKCNLLICYRHQILIII